MIDLLNKITLGDAYKLIKQLPDKSVDMIYTDIPYLHTTGGTGHSEICTRTLRKKQQLAEIDKGIDYSIFDDFIRVSKSLNCYIWCSRLQVPEILNYFLRRGCLFDILFWGKTNPMPTANNNFLPDVEYCLYFRDNGVKLNDGYELKSKYHISPINKREKDLYEHPTIKPISLVTRHVLHASQNGDIILDPFVGSGTTALAARNTGRQFIAFENSPKWHKVADDRLNGIQANGQIMFFSR